MSKTDDATQQGAPAGEQEAVAQVDQQQFRNPRDEAMERMTQVRRQALAADGVPIEQQEQPQGNDEEVVPPGVDTDEAAAVGAGEHEDAGEQVDELDAAAQVAKQLEPTVISDGFDKVRVRAKVDGEELEVPLDQVLRQFQKNSAADRRLAEATRLLNEARERTTAPADQAKEDSPSADDADTRELASKAAAALLDGDENAVAEIFSKMMQGRQKSQDSASAIPSTEVIAQQVKQQIEVESALSTFQKDYDDVCSDPHLFAMAERLVMDHRAQGKSFADALQRAGNDVRDWLKEKAMPTSQGTDLTTSRNERLERKAKLDNVRAASVTATSPVSQPKTEEQIRSDALAELRRARPGQA